MGHQAGQCPAKEIVLQLSLMFQVCFLHHFSKEKEVMQWLEVFTSTQRYRISFFPNFSVVFHGWRRSREGSPQATFSRQWPHEDEELQLHWRVETWKPQPREESAQRLPQKTGKVQLLLTSSCIVQLIIHIMSSFISTFIHLINFHPHYTTFHNEKLKKNVAQSG